MKPHVTWHNGEVAIKPKSIRLNGRQTILLVDDDCAILEGVRLRLRASGYDTLDAHDGSQGVATAIKSKPDAIIMDVRMPRMGGVAALLELQENEVTKNIPVVILSASLTDQQSALDAGARFFLSKPYDGKNLVAAIDSVLGKRKRPNRTDPLADVQRNPNSRVTFTTK